VKEGTTDDQLGRELIDIKIDFNFVHGELKNHLDILKPERRFADITASFVTFSHFESAKKPAPSQLTASAFLGLDLDSTGYCYCSVRPRLKMIALKVRWRLWLVKLYITMPGVIVTFSPTLTWVGGIAAQARFPAFSRQT
jgi:hypothetical protein